MFCNTSHMDRITPLPDHTLCQIGIEFIRIHFFDSARLPDACQIGQCQIVPDQQGGQIARSSSPDHSQIAFDYPVRALWAHMGPNPDRAPTRTGPLPGPGPRLLINSTALVRVFDRLTVALLFQHVSLWSVFA